MMFTILHHVAVMFKAQVTITGSTFMDDVWMIFSLDVPLVIQPLRWVLLFS
jgi:hypothetical protein